jgi:hypothetical protein
MTTSVTIHAHPAPPNYSVEVTLEPGKLEEGQDTQSYLLAAGATLDISVSGTQTLAICEAPVMLVLPIPKTLPTEGQAA